MVVQIGTPEDQFADLRAGRLDMIVGRLNPLAQPGQETTKALYEEPICLVTLDMITCWRLTRSGPRQCWSSSPGSSRSSAPGSARNWRNCWPAGVWACRANRVECTSYLTLHRLIITTDAIGLLPTLVVAEDSRMRALAQFSELRQTIGVTSVAARTLTPTAAELLGHLIRAGEQVRYQIDRLPSPPKLDPAP